MDAEFLVYKAKCDLQKATYAVEDALRNVKEASELGFKDVYQIQEFSRKASDLLGAASDGLAVELLQLDNGVE